MSEIDIQLTTQDIQEVRNVRGTCGARGIHCRNLQHFRCPIYRHGIIKMLEKFLSRRECEHDGGLSEKDIKKLFDTWKKDITFPVQPVALEYLHMQCRNKKSVAIEQEDGIPFDTVVANGSKYSIQHDIDTKHFVLQSGVYQVDWTVALHDGAAAKIALIVDGKTHSPAIRETKTISGSEILPVPDGAIVSLDVVEAKGQGAKLSADDLQANIRFVKIG